MNQWIAFGALDNLILLGGVLVGADVGRYFERLHPVMGVVLGALIGNAISDGVAGLAFGVVPAILVTVGCLSVLVLIPLVARRIRRTTV